MSRLTSILFLTHYYLCKLQLSLDGSFDFVIDIYC